jgi:hypothetical protein
VNRNYGGACRRVPGDLIIRATVGPVYGIARSSDMPGWGCRLKNAPRDTVTRTDCIADAMKHGYLSEHARRAKPVPELGFFRPRP